MMRFPSSGFFLPAQVTACRPRAHAYPTLAVAGVRQLSYSTCIAPALVFAIVAELMAIAGIALGPSSVRSTQKPRQKR